MHFVQDLAKGILGFPDSIELWEESINSIPDADLVYKGQNFLFPAIGHGTEVKVMAKRLTTLGWTASQIYKHFYLCDKYNTFTKEPLLLGFRNVYQCDFMELELDMKFDIVIGNPPYQEENKNNAGTKKYWNQFIKKSLTHLKDTGTLIFINPTDWLKIGYKEFEYLKEHLVSGRVLTDTEKKKYFPGIGSTFGVIELRKHKVDSMAVIKNSDTEVCINLNDFHILPKDGSPISISIFNKIIEPGKFLPFKGSTHRGAVIREGEYRFLHGIDEQYHDRATTKSDVYENWKVLIPEMQSYYKHSYMKDCDTGQGVFSIVCDSEQQAEQIHNLIDLKLYHFIADRCKFSSRNNLSTTQLFPAVDYTRSWTDAELYAHFNLTQEEIEYVESTVK